MSQHQDPDSSEARRAVEEQIAFVLKHPGTSTWLKVALRGALDRHPIDMLNDLIKGREVFSNVGAVARSSTLTLR